MVGAPILNGLAAGAFFAGYLSWSFFDDSELLEPVRLTCHNSDTVHGRWNTMPYIELF